MSANGLRYVIATAGVALVVCVLGGYLGESAGEVYTGALLGAGIQIMGWLAVHRIYPENRFHAYLLGMILRVIALGLVALVWIPWVGISPAPVLLALVAVYFGSTLTEPLFMRTELSTHS